MDTPIIVEDQRGHGWTPIDHALLDTYGAQIGPYGLAIYLALARHVNTRTQTCYPSYERLAQLTGMSRPQAMRAVKKLIEAGLIAKQARSNAKKDATANQANVFILLPLQAAPAVRRTVDSAPTYNAQQGESLPDTPPEYPTDTPGVSVSNPRSIPQIPKQESINKKQENKTNPPAANAAAGQSRPPAKQKAERDVTGVPKPSAGWDFPLLWQLITGQQGYPPVWDYAKETDTIKRLLSKFPGAQPADFARFLAYVGTCWPFCDEPTRQPTFSEGAKHFGAWYTSGQPERFSPPEKQRSHPNGQRPASTSSDRERDKLIDIASYLAS